MKESKLVVLGAGGVGKSSLILQYLQGTFSTAYRPTVEDCYNHTVQLPNGLYHALEILDTAGSHHFPAMRELSIRSGKAFVIVFAVNNQQSFYEAQSLCALIKKIKDVDNVPVVMVGNKIDLSVERNVSWQSAHDYVACNISNGSYLETSAKYNLYINDVFNELLILAFGNPKQEKTSRYSRLSLSISDISFSSYRRKSSSTYSSTSTNTLNTTSSHSCSDYSFNTPELSQTESSYSCTSESSASECQRSPRSRKKTLSKCLSALTQSAGSQRRFQSRSMSMFSQRRRKGRNGLSLTEQQTEKCVFL